MNARMLRPIATLLVACLAVLSVPATAEGQIGALRRKAEEEARKKLEEASKKNAADSAARAKAVADSVARMRAADSSRASGAGAGTSSSAATAPRTTPDPKVWENYDFVPGSKVIFYTDFSEDRVGNFARGLKYASGPAEIVERDGVKMLRAIGRSEFLIPVGKQLPQRFTLELDVIGPPSGVNEMVSVEGGARMDRGATSGNLIWGPKRTWIEGSGMTGANSTVNFPEAFAAGLLNTVSHLRILMDSGYLKMYVNERRVYNRPDFAFQRDSVIRVVVWGMETEGNATYVTGIRVAESETDVLYDALAARGRWATHGILFATGKADLKPESHAVLKDIAATMKKYGDLKILIEGHTDNIGSAASNLSLSDARAASVKDALVSSYGIDASRLATRGLGDTTPSAPNATAAGRAQNRRVELVRQ